MNHTEEEFAATCASLCDALNLILIEGKVYAAHNKLPHVAQTMYDIAEAALSDTSECGTPRGEAGDRAGPPVSPHTAKLGADDGK